MTIYNSKTVRLAGNERGTAAVEFALVVVVLLVILSGTVEFGKSFWYYNSLDRPSPDQ